MAVYASLLSTIPLPSQNWQTQSTVPSVASIKVGDISNDCTQKLPGEDSFSSGILSRLRNYFLQKRLQKLESIPPEKRTAVQQAEIEANKKSLDCVV